MKQHHHPRPFGMDFTTQSERELANEIARSTIPDDQCSRLIATANVAHIVDLAKNGAFRDAYRHAWRVTADGMPVYLYARWRGVPLKDRLTGSGLVGELFPLLEPNRHRVFIIAANAELADHCRAYFASRGFAPESVGIDVPPFGFERDPAAAARLADAVRAMGATHLFVGVGAPKSELWADRHRETLGPCYVLCIGAGLEFFFGLRSRGPVWVRSAGFEWLWRFAQEPKRLFRRYFVDSWRFLGCISRDLRGQPIV